MGSLCGSLLGMVFKEENITGLVHIPQGWAINYHHSNWESSFMNLFHGGSHTISSEIERHHQQSLSPCIESSTNHVWIQTQGQNFSFFYLFIFFYFFIFWVLAPLTRRRLHACMYATSQLGWVGPFLEEKQWGEPLKCPMAGGFGPEHALSFVTFFLLFILSIFFSRNLVLGPVTKAPIITSLLISFSFGIVFHCCNLQATELEIFI